jgi:hypothetical protein
MGEEAEAVKSSSQSVDEMLDSYEKMILPAEDKGAMRYINMSQHELNAMSAEDCNEAAVMLTSLAFHVAKACNKLRAKIRYCNEAILKCIASRTANYRYNSPDERKALAIQEDDFASNTKRQEVSLSCRLERIDYLSLRLEKVADMFASLAATKRRQQ